MKRLKVLTIVLFSLFLSFSVLYAQENKTADPGTNNLQNNEKTVNVSGAETEKTVTTEKVGKEVFKPDPEINKKVPVIEKKSESRKAVSKKNSGKKEIPVTADIKKENIDQNRMEGDLLLINEGNFKYKRIPDIKLSEIKPQAADSNMQVAEAPKSVQNKSGGFLGLSKTASEIIIKGGVLLLMLLIFVLYKSRMSHPVRKSSKKRNVLNSFRK